MKNKVILGMSGGVDSSVALYLLKEQGFDVIGVTLDFGCNDLTEGIKIAKANCKKYGCQHVVLNSKDLFKKNVIDYFLNSLKKNETPDPCVMCNRYAKIDSLIAFAKQKDADLVATGHYATMRDGELVQSSDKDQSYFLCLLKRSQLKKLIFPIAGYEKKEIYSIAKKQGIKYLIRESQDLCFTKNMDSFIEENLGFKKGNIINKKGNVLGQHNGLYFYTIGQRKGIKLHGGPYYVMGFNGSDVIVTKDEKDLDTKIVNLKSINLLRKDIPKKVLAKVRFRQELSEAKLDLDKKQLIFKNPQRAVTPGQIAAFYDEDVCLGGGIIKK